MAHIMCVAVYITQRTKNVSTLFHNKISLLGTRSTRCLECLSVDGNGAHEESEIDNDEGRENNTVSNRFCAHVIMFHCKKLRMYEHVCASECARASVYVCL